MAVILTRPAALSGVLTRPAGLRPKVTFQAYEGSLVRPAALSGVLTRPAGLRPKVTFQAYEGSLVRPAALSGVLTRPAGLRGVFEEYWRPPEVPAGAIQVGDLGTWRPRIRGVLGSGEAPTAWKLLGHTLYPGGSTSQYPQGIGTPLFASVSVSAVRGQPEPAHYVPGALRPAAFPWDGTAFTKDIIRVTDSLGTYRDMALWWHATRAEYAPADQALSVAIGTDGVAALYSGGELALTATGGTGPYVWDIVTNRSGCTLTAEGAYVAGPAVGIDRVRVTDSLGAIGLAQLEVIPGQLGVDMTGDPETDPSRFNVFGYQCQPYALVWGQGGVAPYAIEVFDNQTGGTVVPAWEEESEAGLSTRVRLEPIDAAGQRVNVRRLDMSARAIRADGIGVGDVVVHPVSDWAVEMMLPHPGDLGLWETHLVLRVEATPADGGEVVVIEALFESPSESAYAAAQ